VQVDITLNHRLRVASALHGPRDAGTLGLLEKLLSLRKEERRE